MTRREELLSVPKRKWDETIRSVSTVYIIPSKRKHESGYACMDLVAVTDRDHGNRAVRFGGGCDDISLRGNHFRIDCEHPSRIIRIWNSHGTFLITDDLSSIHFVEEQET